MSLERDDSLEGLFLETSGHARTAGDVAALLTPLFDKLDTALLHGSALGDEWGTNARENSDREIRTAAIGLGEAAIASMRGLIISRSVDQSTTLPRTSDPAFAPLSAAWQTEPDQYAAAVEIVRAQMARTESLRAQPNQLYRRLADVVAFAADLAGWTAWVDL